MSHHAPDFQACDVCGRTILKGERAYAYRRPDGEEADVCSLCRERAEASGWVPAGHADAPEPARRRTEGGLLERLRSRRRGRDAGERVSDPPLPGPGPGEGAGETPHPPVEPPREPEPEPEPPPAPEPPLTPERALAALNATEAPRRIAGLTRSLGPPRASVRTEAEAAFVVVAWELSWYRWRVERDGAVAEAGHGDELSELEPAEREWNAATDADGRVVLE